jgi:hypothetical protein
MDFHTFDDHDKTDQDDTDFEYITAILGSFTDLKTMEAQNNKKKNQNYGPRGPYEDATLHTCKTHQATPSKFNYELIIKMPVPQHFSYDLTWEPDTLNSEIKNFEPEVEVIQDTKKISAILQNKIKNWLSTWNPFIAHNDNNKVASSGSHIWHYSQQLPWPSP